MDRIWIILGQRFHSVNRLAYYIHHSALDLFSRGHGDGASRRDYFHSTLQSIGIIHGYTTNRVFTNVLLSFDYQLRSILAFDA